jgi:hypothetical protein
VQPHLFEYWKDKDTDVRVYQELPAGLNYHQLMKESRSAYSYNHRGMKFISSRC